MNDIIRAALSSREAEVCEGLLEGLSNREIAERLGIAESTVKSFLNKMFHRFHVAKSERLKRVVFVRMLLCQ